MDTATSTIAPTEILNLQDLEIRPGPPVGLSDLYNRLTVQDLGKLPFARAVENAGDKFNDYADFLARAVTTVELETSAHTVRGHQIAIVSTAAYAQELSLIRALRRRAEGSGTDAEAAAADLQKEALRNRVLPEDLIAVIDELPDSRYFTRLFLENQGNAEELWVQLTYDRNFLSAASVMPNGDTMFYRTERNVFLRLNVFHEFSHRLADKFPEHQSAFNHAVDLEKNNFWPGQPGTYALRNYGEHWGVMGEELLHMDASRFHVAATKAPLRAAIWMRALELCLAGSLEHRPSTCYAAYVARCAWTRTHVQPAALKVLDTFAPADNITAIRKLLS